MTDARHTAVELTLMQRLILACVQRQPGQFSRSGLAKLLAGSQSKRLGEAQNSPDYGRQARYSRKAFTGRPSPAGHHRPD